MENPLNLFRRLGKLNYNWELNAPPENNDDIYYLD
jgi:hypothetical protein